MKIQVNVGLRPFQQHFIYIGWWHLDANVKTEYISTHYFVVIIIKAVWLQSSSYPKHFLLWFTRSARGAKIRVTCENTGNCQFTTLSTVFHLHKGGGGGYSDIVIHT